MLQHIDLHIIFDVNMGEKVLSKYWMLGGRNKTFGPVQLTYLYVVSRDNEIISLTVAELNISKLLALEIQNSYLKGSFREKIWTRSGPSFKYDSVRIVFMVRKFYLLNSIVSAFRALLANSFHEMGYEPYQPYNYMRI